MTNASANDDALLSLIKAKAGEFLNKGAPANHVGKVPKIAYISFVVSLVVFVCALFTRESLLLNMANSVLAMLSFSCGIAIIVFTYLYDAPSTPIDCELLTQISLLQEQGHAIDQRFLRAVADRISDGSWPTYGEVLDLAKKYKPLPQAAQAFVTKFASNRKDA